MYQKIGSGNSLVTGPFIFKSLFDVSELNFFEQRVHFVHSLICLELVWSSSGSRI